MELKVDILGMLRKIFKTGHSVAVTISKQLLKELGLKVGDAVDVEASEDKKEIIIRLSSKNLQMTVLLNSRPKLGQRIK